MTSRTQRLALAALFAALTAAGALTSIPLPLTPVPITLQSFFTILSGLILGARLGALSQALYVAIRVTGLSQPAGAPPSIASLFGPTGGYLIGFVAGAYVVGLIAAQGQRLTPLRAVSASAAGMLVIYALGVAQLTNFFAANSGLELETAFVRASSGGVIPFLPGDALKIIGAVLISTRKQINDVRARVTWGPGSRQ